MTKEDANIITESAKILKDYPQLSYSKAVEKAKEVIKDESNARV